MPGKLGPLRGRSLARGNESRVEPEDLPSSEIDNGQVPRLLPLPDHDTKASTAFLGRLRHLTWARVLGSQYSNRNRAFPPVLEMASLSTNFSSPDSCRDSSFSTVLQASSLFIHGRIGYCPSYCLFARLGSCKHPRPSTPPCTRTLRYILSVHRRFGPARGRNFVSAGNWRQPRFSILAGKCWPWNGDWFEMYSALLLLTDCGIGCLYQNNN